MTNKTALVTGGSGGIGGAICRKLAETGYYVAVNYYSSKAEAEALAAEIGGIAIHADVTIPNEVDDMFAKIGEPDVLVNNAGIALYELFQLTAPEQRRSVIDVNLHGAMNCSAAALPAMICRKCGSIVNISSVWGEYGAAMEVVYSASKAALIGFTKSLAKEVAPSGIRVNAVSPGLIDTKMNARFSAEDIAALGGCGTPEDVAATVAWLVSDASGFVNGAVIPVNGGNF
ncbi:MAG: SDR family oxidoreductase [Oscillospiraceae bacterium]|jgi:3-oxoacyl-[acyl-carrier protein] reductase|nr:SDR family oxidoreductase [Oscillospiraceae bacterium]